MSVSNAAVNVTAERDFSPYGGARHIAVPLREPNFLDRALAFRERV